MVVTWCWGGALWAERITFLSAYYVPGSILGALETTMSKTVEHQHCLLFVQSVLFQYYISDLSLSA